MFMEVAIGLFARIGEYFLTVISSVKQYLLP